MSGNIVPIDTKIQEGGGAEEDRGGTEGQPCAVEEGLETEADQGARAEPSEHVAKVEQAGQLVRVELTEL